MEMSSQYVEQIREKDGPLIDHLREIGNLAGKFAGEIGLRDIAHLLGLLHDIGELRSILIQSYRLLNRP
ncbi:HD domain-containing protein [Porticoccus sp.]|uniref:HD domain-containing protein n=1 Tax=Porticoccus sp. TaxID=2024853 RepID=UPI000C4A0867|nr:hypothetical protein [Porticoccus sp.]